MPWFHACIQYGVGGLADRYRWRPVARGVNAASAWAAEWRRQLRAEFPTVDGRIGIRLVALRRLSPAVWRAIHAQLVEQRRDVDAQGLQLRLQKPAGVADSSALVGLEVTVLLDEIDTVNGQVAVWLCHDTPHDHPDNHSCVAGFFHSFAAAHHALRQIEGLRVAAIYERRYGAPAPIQVQQAASRPAARTKDLTAGRRDKNRGTRDRD